MNIGIHGITRQMVKKALPLPDLLPLMDRKLAGNVVVHHTHFDRTAMNLVAVHHNKKCFACNWLDSAKVARSTWQQVSRKGYGLDDLSLMLEIQREKPLDALDDAITAGRVVEFAIKQSGRPLPDWVKEQNKNHAAWQGSHHISDNAHKYYNVNQKEFHELAAKEPDPNGPMYGEVVVFTGELPVPRLDAAQVFYMLGCDIDERVTRKTTMLVVGEQDEKLLKGQEKSTKERAAEELIAQGQNIRIINGAQIMSMISC